MAGSRIFDAPLICELAAHVTAVSDGHLFGFRGFWEFGGFREVWGVQGVYWGLRSLGSLVGLGGFGNKEFRAWGFRFWGVALSGVGRCCRRIPDILGGLHMVAGSPERDTNNPVSLIGSKKLKQP